MPSSACYLTIVDQSTYLCPGETQPISRAVHLARLTGFYHKCRDCPHRADTGTISARRARQLQETSAKRAARSWFEAEGLAADYLNDFTPLDARRVALAFGTHLSELAPCADAAVLIGGDGGGLTPEIIAAASEGLRGSGLAAVEVGPCSVPALVFAQQRAAALGCLYIAQSSTPRYRITMRFWGPSGRPFSSPGALDRIQAGLESRPRRSRRFGPRARRPIGAEYPRTLEPYFHALRPLRFVVACSSPPLLAQLEQLLSRVGCVMLNAHDVQPAQADLGAKVLAARAHFGLAIGEGGQKLEVLDERGGRVAPQHLLSLMTLAGPTSTGGASGTRGSAECGVRSAECGLTEPVDLTKPTRLSGGTMTREATFDALSRGKVPLFCDEADRYWFSVDGHVSANALRALALLLVALSSSDRPLSHVVAALAAC